MKAKTQRREIDRCAEAEGAESMAVFADVSRPYANTPRELATGSSDGDRAALSPEVAATIARRLIEKNADLFKQLS